MLLTIDIGNSNIVFGLFRQDKLTTHLRLPTEKNGSAETYVHRIEKLLGEEGGIEHVVIGSVVPELDAVFTDISDKLWQKKPLFVTTELKTDIHNLHPKYSELGADRLANIVAALGLHTGNCIVIDLGTATKFDAISGEGEYQGGAIAPGLETSLRVLLSNASKLHDFSLGEPSRVVAQDSTIDHLNSGFVYGFSSLIDGMIIRMRGELNWERPHVILTGGLSPLVQKYTQEITLTDPTITLKGLRLLFTKNR